MRGLTPAFTVRALKRALNLVPEDAEVLIMPEESDGYRIGGVIQIAADPKSTNSGPQVWLLLEDDVAQHDGAGDDDEESSVIDYDSLASQFVGAATETPSEPEDVVQVRGLLKSA